MATTLVELVLYLALFSMIILVMVQFFVFISNKNVDARNRLEISRSIIFLRQHFNVLEKDVNSISSVNSVFDNDNGKLVVATDSGNITYQLENNRVVMNNGSNIYLTPEAVVISKLRFEDKVDSLNNVIGVDVFITVTHINVVNYSESIDFLLQVK